MSTVTPTSNSRTPAKTPASRGKDLQLPELPAKSIPPTANSAKSNVASEQLLQQQQQDQSKTKKSIFYSSTTGTPETIVRPRTASPSLPEAPNTSIFFAADQQTNRPETDSDVGKAHPQSAPIKKDRRSTKAANSKSEQNTEDELSNLKPSVSAPILSIPIRPGSVAGRKDQTRNRTRSPSHTEKLSQKLSPPKSQALLFPDQIVSSEKSKKSSHTVNSTKSGGTASARFVRFYEFSTSTEQNEDNDTATEDMLMEYDDDALFPGYNFNDDALNRAATPMLSSTVSNPLDAMTDEERAQYEKFVFDKYFKDGVLTTFKGKDELRAEKARKNARREIDQVKEAMKQKESQFAALEDEMKEVKKIEKDAINEATRIARDITSICNTFHAPNYRTDITTINWHNFRIPTDPQVLASERFKHFKEQFDEQAGIIRQGESLIEELEMAVDTLDLDYRDLQVLESQLRPIEKELIEAEVQEYCEQQVVAKFRVELAKQKASTKEHVLQRQKEQAEKEALEAMKLHAQKEKELEMKRNDIYKHVKARRDKINEELKRAQEERTARVNKRTKMLQELKSKCNTAREKAAELGRQKQKAKFETLGLNEELTTNDRIAKTIIHVKTREYMAQKEFEQTLENIESSKMGVLEKLVNEEERRRKEERHSQYQQSLDTWKPAASEIKVGKTAADLEAEFLAKKVTAVAEPNVNTYNAEKSLAGVLPKLRPLPGIGSSDDYAQSLEFGKNTVTRESQLLDSVLDQISKEEPVKKRLPPPRHKLPQREQPQLTFLADTPPFTANPATVIFDDIDPPTVYTRKVVLTNTSCQVNTFKLLPIPVDLATYFEVDWSPPGHMSAGMTSEVTIVFRPPPGFNENIRKGAISFQAEYGGVFSVEIGCETKKCYPRLSSVSGGDGAGVIKFDDKKEQPATPTTSVHSKATSSPVRNKKVPVAQKNNDNDFVINFGKCLMGGKSTRYIELANSGALNTDFEIFPVGEDATTKSYFQITKVENKQLNGYGTTSFAISFVPPYDASKSIRKDALNVAGGKSKSATEPQEYHHSTQYQIRFISEDTDVKPININCIASSVEAPLYIDRDLIDFKLVVVDRCYRERIVIRNNHHIALKFQISFGEAVAINATQEDTPKPMTATNSLAEPGARRPETIVESEEETKAQNEASKQKELKQQDGILNIGELEFSPTYAFVQPQEPFTLWLKFRPSKDGYHRFARGKNEFELPLNISYVHEGVRCQIPFAMRGKITSTEIEFQPNGILDFGKNCSIDEIASIPVKIINRSRMPQKLQFKSLHPSLSIGPLDSSNCLNLKPLQTLTRRVLFTPSECGVYEGGKMKILCSSDWDEKYEINCKGIGVQSPLRFQQNVVHFKSTAVGSTSYAHVKLSHVQLQKAALKLMGRSGVSNDDEEWYFEMGTPKVEQVVVKDASGKLVTKMKADESGAPPHTVAGSDAYPIRLWPTSGIIAKGESKIINIALSPLSPADKIENTGTSRLSLGSTDDLRLKRANSKGTLIDLEARSNKDKDANNNNNGSLNALNSDATTEKDSKNSTGKNCTATTAAGASLPPQPGTTTANATNAPAAAAGKTKSTSSKTKSSTKKTQPSTTNSNTLAPPATPPPAVAKSIETLITGSSMALSTAPSSRTSSFADGLNESRLSIATTTEMLIPEKIKRLEEYDDTAYSIIIPFTIKRATSEAEKLRRLLNADADFVEGMAEFKTGATTSIREKYLTHLKVVAPCVRPAFAILSPESQKLDFDRVPVSQSSVRSFVIKNLSNEKLQVRMNGLNPMGPFYLVNAIKPIPPMETQQVRIGFRPAKDQVYSTEFELETPTTVTVMKVSGSGCIPSVVIEPTNNSMSLGDVLLGETSTKSFKIHNTSAFPVSCTLQLGAKAGTQNLCDGNPFTLSPNDCVIPPGTRQEVTVKFAPDHESDMFWDYARIQVFGLPKDIQVKLLGRCWQNTFFLSNYEAPLEQESTFKRKAILPRTDVVDQLKSLIPPDDCLSLPGLADSTTSELSPEQLAKREQINSLIARVNANGNNINGEVITVEELASFIQFEKLASYGKTQYVTMKCPWMKVVSDNGVKEEWKVDARELVLNFMRPNNIKVDPAKKLANGEFSVETFPGTFDVDERGQVVVTMKDSLRDSDSVLSFTMDPVKGSLEFGGTKVIKVALTNPVADFWTSMGTKRNFWYNGIREDNQANPQTNATKGAPGDKKSKNAAASSVSPSTGITAATPAANNTKAATPPGSESTNNDNLSGNQVATSTQPQAQSTQSSQQPHRQQTTQEILLKLKQPGTIPSPQDISSLYTVTSGVTSSAHKREVTIRPRRIETCFKITLKGGYNIAEPRGFPSSLDDYQRVFIVKVLADPDDGIMVQSGNSMSGDLKKEETVNNNVNGVTDASSGKRAPAVKK